MKRILYIFPLLMLWACENVPEYPEEPVISFSSITKYVVVDPFTTSKTDSIVVALDFTDGDGDLGLSDSDVGTGIYVSDSAENFHVEVERNVGGIYESVSMDLDARFDPVVSEQYEGPIDGVLEHSIELNHNLVTELSSGDIIRFKIYVYDRQLNKSNEVITSDITILQ